MNKLYEIFDRPESYSEFKKDDEFIYSLFSVKDKDYFVGFYYSTPQYFDMVKNMYHISFENIGIRDNYAFAFGLMDSSFKKDFDSPVEFLKAGKVDDSNTNTGDVFKVFSTVGHIFVDFMKKYKPDGVYYAAKELNRSKIYQFLTKKLISLFSSYTSHEENQFFIVYKKALKESRLKELFDSPVPYTKNDDFQYTFNIENIPEPYIVRFKKREVEEFLNNLQEEFYMQVKPKKLDFWGVEYEFTLGERHKQTHTGNASFVFSTVGAILKEFIEKKNPDYFYFEAANIEDSRVRVYEILAKEIHRKYPQYEFIQMNAPYREVDMYLLYKPETFELKDNY
jgi:hypothetical protein